MSLSKSHHFRFLCTQYQPQKESINQIYNWEKYAFFFKWIRWANCRTWNLPPGIFRTLVVEGKFWVFFKFSSWGWESLPLHFREKFDSVKALECLFCMLVKSVNIRRKAFLSYVLIFWNTILLSTRFSPFYFSICYNSLFI